MTTYSKVADALKKELKLGKLTPGMRLPKETVFAGQLGISRNTLRSALDQLQESGLVIRRKRGGTVIASDALEHLKVSFEIGLAVNLGNGDAQFPMGQPFVNDYGILLRRLLDDGACLRIIDAGKSEIPVHLDGVVVPSPMDSLKLLKVLAEKKIPHVALESSSGLPGVCTVMADDEDASRRSLIALHSLGHEKIAYIGGNLSDPERNNGFRRRFCGFLRGCRETGLNPDPKWLFNVEHQGTSYYDMAELLENFSVRIRGCTAAVCAIGQSVGELEKMRRICGADVIPPLEIRCVDLRPFNEPGLWSTLAKYQGFVKPHCLLAELSHEKLLEWIGNPKFRPECFKVPFQVHVQKSE